MLAPTRQTPEIAADSITAGLLHTIDFPAVVRAAYRDGVRLFLEAGPGNSCSRMIAAILGDEPHVVRSLSVRRQSELSQLLRMLAQLIAERVPVQLDALYQKPARNQSLPSHENTLTLPVGLKRGPIPSFALDSSDNGLSTSDIALSTVDAPLSTTDSPLTADEELPLMGVFERMAPLPTEEPAMLTPTLVAQVPGHDTPAVPLDDEQEPGSGSTLYSAETMPLTTPILAGSLLGHWLGNRICKQRKLISKRPPTHTPHTSDYKNAARRQLWTP